VRFFRAPLQRSVDNGFRYVFLLLLINKGIRKMEAFIIASWFFNGLSYFEMIFAQPEMDKVLIGLILRLQTKRPYTSP
jgi:Mn2+/Fe2+ NRAMP family transporter